MDDDVRGDRGVEKARRRGGVRREEDDAQAYKNALSQRHGEEPEFKTSAKDGKTHRRVGEDQRLMVTVFKSVFCP